MFKKILTLLMSMTLILTFTACSGGTTTISITDDNKSSVNSSVTLRDNSKYIGTYSLQENYGDSNRFQQEGIATAKIMINTGNKFEFIVENRVTKGSIIYGGPSSGNLKMSGDYEIKNGYIYCYVKNVDENNIFGFTQEDLENDNGVAIRMDITAFPDNIITDFVDSKNDFMSSLGVFTYWDE